LAARCGGCLTASMGSLHPAPRRPWAAPRGMWRLPLLALLLTPPAAAGQLLPDGGDSAFFISPLLQQHPPARQTQLRWYAALIKDIPSVLVCYACTALRRALSEWHRNGGRRPAQQPGRPLKSGVYPFSEACGRGNNLCCPARCVLWANVHTRRVYAAGEHVQQLLAGVSRVGT
jgi:hypothetical protein